MIRKSKEEKPVEEQAEWKFAYKIERPKVFV
jgi:hypothetical protein